jgi:hypothetical protein
MAEHRKNPGMSKDEAKVAFLKKMQSWPTFGSVFFEAQVQNVANKLYEYECDTSHGKRPSVLISFIMNFRR